MGGLIYGAIEAGAGGITAAPVLAAFAVAAAALAAFTVLQARGAHPMLPLSLFRSRSVPVLSALMILVGLGGPLVMPPVMALLLQAVPARRAGVASGVFNTSRQAGGTLAVAVFGALLASRATFLPGLRDSLLVAAAVSLGAAAVSLLLRAARSGASLH